MARASTRVAEPVEVVNVVSRTIVLSR